MSIRSPKIPSSYRALDSEAFNYKGPPAGAFLFDSVAQAHNRLQAGQQPMFCHAVPIDEVERGEDLEARFSVLTRRTWGRLVPDITCMKKPGATLAQFKALLRLPLDELVDLQVTTRALPQWRRGGHVTVVGTGDWEIYTISNIGVLAGPQEACALWVKNTGPLDIATGIYGSPVSADIKSIEWGVINCEDSVDITWDTAPPSWASEGYVVRVLDPGGREYAVLDIKAVTLVPDQNGKMLGRLYVDPPATGPLIQPANSSLTPWTFEIAIGLKVEFACFAGVTQQRTV